MAQVKKLSAKNCLHYKRGHCLIGKTDPPQEEKLCTLILERKRIGHRTLERLKRLERFGLTLQDRQGWVAQRYIVNHNMKEMAGIACKNFIESGLNYPSCIQQVQSQCLLKMEICPGRCPEFSVKRKEV